MKTNENILDDFVSFSTATVMTTVAIRVMSRRSAHTSANTPVRTMSSSAVIESVLPDRRLVMAATTASMDLTKMSSSAVSSIIHFSFRLLI